MWINVFPKNVRAGLGFEPLALTLKVNEILFYTTPPPDNKKLFERCIKYNCNMIPPDCTIHFQKNIWISEYLKISECLVKSLTKESNLIFVWTHSNLKNRYKWESILNPWTLKIPELKVNMNCSVESDIIFTLIVFKIIHALSYLWFMIYIIKY